jgi:type IV secretion system protein VirD4
MTNHAMQIVYAPRDQKDANDVSESLGYITEKSRSISRSHGYGKSGGGSESISDQRRALLLPQEVKEIGQWKEIILLENVKPILCDKIRYFDDPEFTSRLRTAPTIAAIDIDLFVAKTSGKKREIEDGEIDLDEYALRPSFNAEYLDIYDKIALPPATDPLDEEEVNQYILDSLEAMHIPKAALANIDFNLDVLDEVKAIMHTTGLDAETARARAEDAFAGLELN